MLDIIILVFGNKPEKYWQSALSEYEKRFKPYGRLKIVELKSAPFSKNSREKAKEIEGEKLEKFLAARKIENIYLLAERGKTFSDSPAFPAWLEKNQPILFVIGGALGFSRKIYDRYPQISLSPLTFPHELARVVLEEQLYRAATILNKKDYHY